MLCAQLAKTNFDKIFDLTAGVLFFFNNVSVGECRRPCGALAYTYYRVTECRKYYINQYPLPPSKKLLTRYYLHDQNKLIPVIVIPGMIILYVVRKWMAPLAPPPKFGSRCCYCTSALVGHAKETQRMPGMLATSQPASQLATHKRTYKYKDEY